MKRRLFTLPMSPAFLRFTWRKFLPYFGQPKCRLKVTQMNMETVNLEELTFTKNLDNGRLP